MNYETLLYMIIKMESFWSFDLNLNAVKYKSKLNLFYYFPN